MRLLVKERMYKSSTQQGKTSELLSPNSVLVNSAHCTCASGIELVPDKTEER